MADENDLEMEIVEADDGDDDDDDGEEQCEEQEEGVAAKTAREVYLPGKALQEGEELVCDESAYIMLHQASTGAPCLSFDILPDDLGSGREKFPLTTYMVAGTQAEKRRDNNVIVMKMSNLHKTQEGVDSDAEEDVLEDDEDDVERSEEEKKPKLRAALIKHDGCVNRVRARRLGNSTFAASWSERGMVNLWNLSKQMQAVEDDDALKAYEKAEANAPTKPLFTFSGHQDEGYAIDWSACAEGVLATGDCKKFIHIWSPMEGGKWKVDQRPLGAHRASVEDLQWSPNERNVLASCSVDKSIRIWDVRVAPQKACMITCENAHTSDINVISWNRADPFIVSGGDDGFLHIWDLRLLQTDKKPIATFKHHTDHISTVEWNPIDSTVLASGGNDDQIAIWDLAVEKDQDEENATAETKNEDELGKLPPQLLFIHQGQQEIKELHWHPQMPGVLMSTANSGFNIFRTISV